MDQWSTRLSGCLYRSAHNVSAVSRYAERPTKNVFSATISAVTAFNSARRLPLNAGQPSNAARASGSYMSWTYRTTVFALNTLSLADNQRDRIRM